MLRAVFPLACVLTSGAAWAQQAPVDAGALSRKLQREAPTPSPSDLPSSVPGKATVPAPKPGEATVTASRFEISGASVLPVAEIQQVLKPWLNRPLSFEALKAACDAVEALHRSRGLLVQVLLPPQKLQDGVVTIHIVQARLGSAIIDTPQGGSRFGEQRARSYLQQLQIDGRGVDLQAVSRAVALLKETPGLAVSSALEAGEQDGQVNLRLLLEDTPLLKGRAELNNQGSSTTGASQAFVQALLNNPLRYGDQMGLTGVYASGSAYTLASYNFPILRNGLRGSVSASALSYSNQGEFRVNGGYGEATTGVANVTYPWIRSDTANANLSLTLESKTYLNRLLALDTVSSHYRLSNLVFSVSGNRFSGASGSASTGGQLQLMWGQLSLLPDSPSNFGTHTPHQFAKLSFMGSRTQPLISDTSNLSLSITGQLATQNLNSAEQFYLGGPYGVRAYPVAQGGGSQGALLSAEYQHRLPWNLLATVFVDAGYIQQYKNTYEGWQGNTNAGNAYGLYGSGLGLRWSLRGSSVSMAAAWKLGINPLYNQQGRPVDVDHGSRSVRVWLTASISI